MLELVIAAIATAAPPEERLRAGADAFLSFVEDHREPWRLMVRNPGEPGVGSPIGEVQSEIARAVAALMQSDVPPERENDPEEASFAHFEVEMFGQQLVGAWRGVGIWWDAHREVPRERLLQTLLDFAWLGLDRLSKGETWEPA